LVARIGQRYGGWVSAQVLQPLDAAGGHIWVNRPGGLAHSGMGLYVAGEFAQWRGPSHPSIEIGRMYHSEPYLDSDLFLFDGNANQVVDIVPSEELIILRMGGRLPGEPVWDNSFLPNTLIRGIFR
jgi:hypothetical protein